VAILMVVAAHYLLGPGIVSAGPREVFAFTVLASGVDLFFVLSGFLIAGILFEARGAPNYFKAFYGRRSCRIFPLYYMYLAVILLQGLVWWSQGRPSPLIDSPMPFWMLPLFLQNFGMAWFPTASWIGVSMMWSLALEEQFYLTLPSVIRTMSTRVIAVCCAVLVAAAPVGRYLIVPRGHSLGALALAALRVDALAAGVLLSIAIVAGVSMRSAVLKAVLGVALIGVVVSGTHLAFMRETAFISAYAAAVWLAVGGVPFFLRARILRFFGTISYALYLLHQAVTLTLHSVFLHSVPAFSTVSSRLVTGLAFGVSVGICALSWKYMERPLASWGHRRFSYE
jgi:peptidoglycan/LPS O-acetylase OafA/YrhL